MVLADLVHYYVCNCRNRLVHLHEMDEEREAQALWPPPFWPPMFIYGFALVVVDSASLYLEGCRRRGSSDRLQFLNETPTESKSTISVHQPTGGRHAITETPLMFISSPVVTTKSPLAE